MANSSTQIPQRGVGSTQQSVHIASVAEESQLNPSASTFVAGSPEHALAVCELARAPTIVSESSTIRPNSVTQGRVSDQSEHTTAHLDSITASLDRMRRETTAEDAHIADRIQKLQSQRRQLMSHYATAQAAILDLKSRRERESQAIGTKDEEIIWSLDAFIGGREDEAEWLKNEKERVDEAIEEAFSKQAVQRQ